MKAWYIPTECLNEEFFSREYFVILFNFIFLSWVIHNPIILVNNTE